MGFPTFEGKHGHDALVTPQGVLAHRRSLGLEVTDKLPPAVVVTYQPQLLDAVIRTEPTTPHTIGGTAETVHALDRTGGLVGVVGRFGIGAPAAAVVVEELIALGARRLVTVGVAGSLTQDLAVGDVVVCDEGVRDEGVSHHYRGSEEPARADPELSGLLLDALVDAGLRPRRGKTGPIDAIYRETVAEARHFAERGALCVEMEAAALFVVAATRRVPLAAVVCISDSLAGAEWDPRYDSERLALQVWAAFQTAVECLRSTEPVPSASG
jgi:uridine phosphorylase